MLRAAQTIAKTDTGRQRRENEDSAFARSPVFVVADGMGGAQAGEVASRIAVETFSRGLPESGSAEERLARRVLEANQRIYEVSISEREHAGMGTTLTAAYLDGSELAIAHVGDSRAYLFRDGTLKRLTQDHSLVDELVRRGKLTEKQAAEHPQRSIITRALGPEPTVEVDTWTYPVKSGDVLLLCSDGLTSMVPEDRLQALLGATGDLEAAAQALIDEANAAGGRDNITVVLFRLEEIEGATDGAADQPTMAGVPAVVAGDGTSRAPAPPTAARTTVGRGTTPGVSRPSGEAPRPRDARRPSSVRVRYAKPLAAITAIVIVLFLVGGGGYLATRNLYFVGTNPQGIVTIYRGLPYDLPLGIHLYETFYVSGLPASLVPPDRRSNIFNNNLRSETSASKLVRQLELGEISP
jgi:serine/threonine protein phosphatase PrpC